jgi:phage shock protein C
MEKKLRRSRTDKKIFGVCGGIAKYAEMDPTMVRLLFAISCICFGCGIGIYLVAALIMPVEEE